MSRMALPEETQVERQLRPQRLDEYVGQRAAVESLRVSVEAARQRREPLDHVLLSGPPGLGKTTLATIMANEMGAAIVTTAGPSLERGGDLMGILTNLSERREWSGELRHHARDGREVVVESRHQILDVDGRSIVLETNRDVTERRRAESAGEMVNP